MSYSCGGMDTKLLNLHGLARELRLPLEWLRDEAKTGRLPCLNVRGRMRFNPDAVRAELAERAKRKAGKP